MAIVILASDTMSRVVEAEEITVVDFWAEWCGPCKALTPVLEDLSDKYEGVIRVAKVNVSENIELAKKYDISSIPCVIVFRAGKEIDRVIGFKGKDSMEDLFIKHS
jgi:thioredoxin 1